MQSPKSSPLVVAMLSVAHCLYNISLNKIVRSRTIRGGNSLHKNLLVASVLHKTYNQIVEAYSNCESLMKLSRETGQPTNNRETHNSLKRSKTVLSECETEEAVLSMLPKKSKSQLDDSDVADLFPEIETELADPNALPSADLISLQEAEDSSSDKENSSLPTTYRDLDSREQKFYFRYVTPLEVKYALRGITSPAEGVVPFKIKC
ncbi:Hypothetical predicted protein [Cloeon dipterum]|uniref:Uncharacterized protein n=1 Tax=Cloeon dipterum TaxID=197152 RepID=A0A8S1C5L8_9INSE|nr:Hypothetical predicted protein [Cloeon dipterum]